MKRSFSNLLVSLLLLVSVLPIPKFQQIIKNKYNFQNSLLVLEPDKWVDLTFFADNIEFIKEGSEYIVRSPNKYIQGREGYPNLPYLTQTIQIPAQVKLRYEILSENRTEIPGISLKFIPENFLISKLTATFPPEISNELLADLSSTTIDIQERNGLMPAEVILLDDYWFRNQHLAKIMFFPVQYETLQQRVTLRDSIKIRVYFEPVIKEVGVLSGKWANGKNPSKNLANGLHDEWLGYTENSVSSVYKSALTVSGIERIKISIDHDGIYKIGYAELVATGFNFSSIDPRNLMLSNQGRDIAIYFSGEQDGSFDPGDYFLFYGEKFKGDNYAQRYANENSGWLTYPNGWRPQITPKFYENYTKENIYWLTPGNGLGLRMDILSVSPDHGWSLAPGYWHTEFKENQYWRWSYFFTGEDTWFDLDVTTTSRERAFPITLSNISAEDFPVTVRGQIVPYDNNTSLPNDHHTILTLNKDEPGAAVVENAYWDGLERHNFEAQVPRSAIHEDEGSNPNNLTLRLMEDSLSTRILFNWFEVSYFKKYTAENEQLHFTDRIGEWGYAINGFSPGDSLWILDVTDPLAPKLVTDYTLSNGSAHFERSAESVHDYFASSQSGLSAPLMTKYTPPDLLSTNNGADYIIISAGPFISGANTLASYRQEKGLRTKVVNLEDIYNEFGDGIKHPIAIKNFLRYAFVNWQQPAPSYVVLVGDDNFNTVGTNRYPQATGYMPPNLGWVDWTQGEVDDTNDLACVVGEDTLPDLAISRIPVNTPEEFAAYVQRVIAYEDIPYSEPWRSTALLVADNVPDPAGDFVAVSNALISDFFVPNEYNSDTVYLDDYADNGEEARDAIVNKLNANSPGVLSYVGHGYTNRWASGSEGMFYTDTIQQLTNSNQLPVVLSMTCLDGSWFYPTPFYVTSIAEEMIRSRTNTGLPRGAIAMWASTGFGTVADHDVLERGFLSAMLNENALLGDASVAGKFNMFSSGGGDDVIQTFTLFGDPALKIVDLSTTPPPVPENIQASDGAFYNKIQITWNTSLSATSYDIYRTQSGGPFAFIASVTNTEYFDTQVENGVLYEYCVSSNNVAGSSTCSVSDMGYAAFGIFLPMIKR